MIAKQRRREGLGDKCETERGRHGENAQSLDPPQKSAPHRLRIRLPDRPDIAGRQRRRDPARAAGRSATEVAESVLNKMPDDAAGQEREMYAEARQWVKRTMEEMERQKALTGCDEVVFLNTRDELTEGARSTLFVEQDGRLFTPALACGLLPGTLREELLDLPRAAASEAVLTPADLAAAERIYLGNSVRGLVRTELMRLAVAETPEPAHAE